MSKLIYTAITSLDGYTEDREGRFDWAVPDAEVHAFINDLELLVGTHLYGRMMYQTMAAERLVTPRGAETSVAHEAPTHGLGRAACAAAHLGDALAGEASGEGSRLLGLLQRHRSPRVLGAQDGEAQRHHEDPRTR